MRAYLRIQRAFARKNRAFLTPPAGASDNSSDPQFAVRLARRRITGLEAMVMDKGNVELVTVESLARQNAVSIWVIERAIGRTGIKPVRRFGTVRTFDAAGAKAIEEELGRVAARRARVAATGV